MMRRRREEDTTMSKVAMIGSITCQAGKADEMAEVLTTMVEAAKDEPGCEIYSYHRAPDDTFWFFALMESEEAMKGHGQSEAMQAAMQNFMPLMAEPPQMTPAAPVAAIGFDL
jgi:quinol monooxygenase YgiN